MTRLSRLGTVELRTRFRQRMRSGDDIWPLLQTHPVDDLCTLDHVLYRRLNSREREAVRSIGSGSERLKLAGSSALLDDPTIGAAWELGRLQTTLRKEFAAFVVESPREVARSIRLSASASPRWTAALLWVQAADAGTVEHSGLRIVTFELPNESAGEAFRTFFRGMQTGELPASIDPTPNWIADRLSAGLALPQCPQIWLSR